MKFLCIITGESFRDGEGQTRGRGTGNSYSNQIKASMSQVNFLHFLEEKFNLKCEIFYNFYKFNDEWDDKLVSIYSNFLVNGSFNFFPIGEANLITQTIDLVKKNINIMNYTFILFFRVDHYLKNYFYTIFDLNKNQILFSFPSIPGIPTYSINEHDLLRDNKIWVDHQIMYVPQKFIYKLLQNAYLSTTVGTRESRQHRQLSTSSRDHVPYRF